MAGAIINLVTYSSKKGTYYFRGSISQNIYVTYKNECETAIVYVIMNQVTYYS